MARRSARRVALPMPMVSISSRWATPTPMPKAWVLISTRQSWRWREVSFLLSSTSESQSGNIRTDLEGARRHWPPLGRPVARVPLHQHPPPNGSLAGAEPIQGQARALPALTHTRRDSLSLYVASTEHTVALVEDGCLPRSQGSLGFKETD